MYGEKINEILNDIENKNIMLAGGGTIGIVLSVTNSLIMYIANLTTGKKKYAQFEQEIEDILQECEKIKVESKLIIDKDINVLEELIKSYKTEEYEQKCRESVEFCLDVEKISLKVLELTNRISKCGNKMLESDFAICMLYAFSALEASIINIKINLESVKDIEYKEKINNEYRKIYKKALYIKNEITKSNKFIMGE